MKHEYVRSMLIILAAVLTLLLAFPAAATTYYVSTSGNNNDNGLTTTTAWRKHPICCQSRASRRYRSGVGRCLQRAREHSDFWIAYGRVHHFPELPWTNTYRGWYGVERSRWAVWALQHRRPELHNHPGIRSPQLQEHDQKQCPDRDLLHRSRQLPAAS